MGGMQLTLFDVIVLAVIGLSALAAFTRGAVTEILGLASWVGAAVVAFLAMPYATPLIRPVVAGDALAAGLAVVGVFIVALLALKLLTGMIAGAISASALGPLDKVAGLLFGAARGAVLVCAAYLVGSYLIKPELQPDWVRQAWLIDEVRSGSLLLERALPEAYRQDGLGSGTIAEPVTDGQGYTDTQRQALDKLVSPQP
jgi:membrane protein required for colicin V production